MTIRSSRICALLFVIVAALAACGVNGEGEPQAIAPEDVPFSLLDPDVTTSSTVAPGSTSQAFLFYLVRSGDTGQVLVPVERSAPVNPSISDVVERLLEVGPDPEDPAEAGLTTRIAEEVELLGVDFNSERRTVTLDFSEDFLPVTGELQATLFAQVVLTVTQLQDVDRVAFELEGVPVSTKTSDGLSEGPVGPSDYADFLPENG